MYAGYHHGVNTMTILTGNVNQKLLSVGIAMKLWICYPQRYEHKNVDDTICLLLNSYSRMDTLTISLRCRWRMSSSANSQPSCDDRRDRERVCQVRCCQELHHFVLADANFEGRAALGRLPPDVPCVSVHRASFAPRDPPRTPTAKDFAEEGRPIEIRQSPWLGAPNRPE